MVKARKAESGSESGHSCPHCGALNLRKARFCSQCGTALCEPGLGPAAEADAARPVPGAAERRPADAPAAPESASPPGEEVPRPQWGRLSREELKALKREVTILFADLARPAGDSAPVSMALSVERLQKRDALLLPVVEKQGGILVKKYGYSVLVRFGEPRAALRTGIAVQKAFADYSTHRTPRDQLHLRMALALGSAVVLENELFGEIVGVVQRLCRQSAPGGILISEVLFRRVENQPEFEFRAAAENAVEVVWDKPASGAPAASQKNACPECGAENLAKALFCGRCGASLAGRKVTGSVSEVKPRREPQP